MFQKGEKEVGSRTHVEGHIMAHCFENEKAEDILSWRKESWRKTSLLSEDMVRSSLRLGEGTWGGRERKAALCVFFMTSWHPLIFHSCLRAQGGPWGFIWSSHLLALAVFCGRTVASCKQPWAWMSSIHSTVLAWRALLSFMFRSYSCWILCLQVALFSRIPWDHHKIQNFKYWQKYLIYPWIPLMTTESRVLDHFLW